MYIKFIKFLKAYKRIFYFFILICILTLFCLLKFKLENKFSKEKKIFSPKSSQFPFLRKNMSLNNPKNDPTYPNYLGTSVNELSDQTMLRSLPNSIPTDFIRMSQNRDEYSNVQVEEMSVQTFKNPKISLDESIIESSMDDKKKMDWKKVAEFIALNPFPDFFCMKTDLSIDDFQDEMFSSRIPKKEVQIQPSDYDIFKKLCPEAENL